MGANLVPIVRDFSIHVEDFLPGSHDVADGCVTPGQHRIMSFDFLSHNIGDADLVVGAPANHPEWFVWSEGHGHYHLKEFNEFKLYDSTATLATEGFKQAFCLIDIEHLSPFGPATEQFTDCNANQGVSSGWADLYHKTLACQFIIVDGVPDGDYTLLSTTNAQQIIPEETFEDNTICTGLNITGDTVTEILPPVYVELKTPTINFNDVPEGQTTVRPAHFEVRSCRSVTFTVAAGPTGGFGTTYLGTSDTLTGSHSLSPRSAHIWFTYTGTNDGDTASGEVTIHCNETNEDFVIPITANTIARPKAVVALVLDKSNSMNFDAGDGRTRIQVLHDSATPFVDRLYEDDAIGIVAFDHDPHDVLPVTVIGAIDDPTDNSRTNARLAILNHTPNPQGNTAIGDGVEKAHQLLEPVGGYDVKATIVLTDGHNTAPKAVEEVTDIIDPNLHIFAIGLGTAEEIQPATLAALAHGHDGYLLMTGTLDDDDLFRLTKYYQQILANVKNEDVVVDPEGAILPGQVHRIPFYLNEADISSDVILLSPYPGGIRFAVETPSGQVINPAEATANPGISFLVSSQSSYYRLTLPTLVGNVASREGKWHALLAIEEGNFRKYLSTIDRNPSLYQSASAHGVRYSLNVHAYSSLRMRAQLTQNSYEIGATLTIRAVLTEYDLPLKGRATVEADLERPDGTTATLQLAEVETGIFETSLVAQASGIYNFRVRANGETFRGQKFTREQLLTGAVWHGGDRPSPTGDADGDGGVPGVGRECCRYLIWLLWATVIMLIILAIILLIKL